MNEHTVQGVIVFDSVFSELYLIGVMRFAKQELPKCLEEKKILGRWVSLNVGQGVDKSETHIHFSYSIQSYTEANHKRFISYFFKYLATHLGIKEIKTEEGKSIKIPLGIQSWMSSRVIATML